MQIDHGVAKINYFTALKEQATRVRKTLVEGKQQLSEIPGVLCVEHGESVDTHGKYTYCWVIRFASEKAIRNFQSDPGQINFTRQYLTPNADQIVTRDYELRAE